MLPGSKRAMRNLILYPWRNSNAALCASTSVLDAALYAGTDIPATDDTGGRAQIITDTLEIGKPNF
jgi:hypothetical protein